MNRNPSTRSTICHPHPARRAGATPSASGWAWASPSSPPSSAASRSSSTRLRPLVRRPGAVHDPEERGRRRNPAGAGRRRHPSRAARRPQARSSLAARPARARRHRRQHPVRPLLHRARRRQRASRGGHPQDPLRMGCAAGGHPPPRAARRLQIAALGACSSASSSSPRMAALDRLGRDDDRRRHRAVGDRGHRREAAPRPRARSHRCRVADDDRAARCSSRG